MPKIDRSDDQIMQENSLFSALSARQFIEIKEGMRVINLKSNENLFDTTTKVNRFYILAEGQLKLYRLSPNGTEKIVEIVRPGEDFAVAAMFMEIKQYPLSCDALKDSRIFAFSNRQLLDLLRQSPETCFRMMANMSRRMRWQLSEIDKLSLQTAPTRLISFLLDHVKTTTSNNCGQVELDSPKRVIASRLSIQPETFSRILKQLSNKDLILVKGQKIIVPDIAALSILIEGMI